MSRLYDRILRYGTVDVSFEQEWDDPRGLPGAYVLGADDVFRYFFAQGRPREDGDDWDVTGDVPSFAPPFERFFVEGALPPAGAMGAGWAEHFEGAGGVLRAVGALISARDFGADGERAARYANARLSPEGGVVRPAGARAAEAVRVADGVRWTLDARVFLEQPGHRKALEGPARLFLAVKPDGEIARLTTGKSARMLSLMPGTTPEQARGISLTLDYVTLPLFLAISFAHCKNVRLRAVDPPEKLSKKHRKKTGRALVRYYVLEIDAMKRVLETEGRRGEVGLRRALHITRGHFKTYGGDDGRGKLFGKHEGMYWWPQHARGSAERGVADKDYSVKAPGGGRGAPGG